MRSQVSSDIIMCRLLRFSCYLALMFGVIVARAQAEAVSQTSSEAVKIASFEFRYGAEHPQLPPIGSLSLVTVPLSLREGVWVVSDVSSTESLTLGKIPEGSRFDAPALRRVVEKVVEHINKLGFFGVWVAYEGIDGAVATNQQQTANAGLVDNRPAGDFTAHLVVWVSQIAEVRTLARGSRFPVEAANNNPKHAWMVALSPLQPGATPDQPGSLLCRDVLEQYLYDLSLQPGRRVESSIASAGKPGKVVLDYLVTETRPWHVYAQVSNTGTKATSEWREHIGFRHTQLTNHDDTLDLNFVGTPNFDSVAGFMSYRIPLIKPVKLEGRIYGSIGDYSANGQVFEELRFTGDNWMSGGELTYRKDFRKLWDLKLSGGANYVHYAVDTSFSDVSLLNGSTSFFMPFLGAMLEREEDWNGMGVGLRVEHSVSGVANDNPDTGINALGRQDASKSWTAMRLSVNYHTFLEPLFIGRDQLSSVAHEVSFRASGKYLLSGTRLVPQEQELIGGASTVRGYPESAVAADESFVMSVEYAFHVPRALAPGEPGKLFGKPFCWRPRRALRPAEWDLILRAFSDYGYRWVSSKYAGSSSVVSNNNATMSERDMGLFSAGLGAEVLFLQNLSLRCDVGMALKDLKDQTRTIAESGDIRAHVAATLYW